MATYFIGTGVESFVTSPTLVNDNGSGLGVVVSTPLGLGFADAFLIDPATGDRAPQASLWFHTVCNTIPLDGPIITFVNAQNVGVLRIFGTNVFGMAQAQRFQGGTWVNLGDPVYCRDSVIWDIRIVSHPTAGRIGVNLNGVTLLNRDGIDTSNMGEIAKVRLQTGTYDTRFDQTIIASYNTIGHTVRRRVPNRDVRNTGWTGGFADVDETNNSDADTINTSTVGAVLTFGADDFSQVATGNVIKAVGLSARIRNDGGDIPRNAAAILTLGGVEYRKPYNILVGAGFSGTSTVFDTNPATGQKWGADIAPVNQPFGLVATE
ncbi:hypothetical protein [Sphingomonas aerolata]|uniref:hypothetical protein n=1 Tax=Sphingomonas aerolata TaxID=185951 RepID=UPI00208F7590|nr:hypothetical protein [Sphingomonas aerolata]USQ99517.1 hypothetical protein NEF64_13985 [Sphingomonas aerolata]